MLVVLEDYIAHEEDNQVNIILSKMNVYPGAFNLSVLWLKFKPHMYWIKELIFAMIIYYSTHFKILSCHSSLINLRVICTSFRVSLQF